MREIRQSGSEGGGLGNSTELSYPYLIGRAFGALLIDPSALRQRSVIEGGQLAQEEGFAEVTTKSQFLAARPCANLGGPSASGASPIHRTRPAFR